MALAKNIALGTFGGLGGLYAGNKSFRRGVNEFALGRPESFEEQSLLTQGQQPLLSNLIAANQGMGAGGSFGTAADYYRNLLSNENQDVEAFAAPEMRRFHQDIVPNLAAQYAGMGSGNLGSSAFQNALRSGSTDLAERIASIRAGLRQQGAAGLTNIGQMGLGQYKENVFRPRTPGFLENIANLGGQVASMYAGKKLGG